MNDIKKSLQNLGLKLPSAPAPAANYVPYVVHGGLLYISGQIPLDENGDLIKGRLGDDMELQDGANAAKSCALNILAQANAAVGGDWSKIDKCIKLGGFVCCTPEFTKHPLVINGASDLITSVMGDCGKHARFAVGAPSLPLGVAVEVEAIFSVK